MDILKTFEIFLAAPISIIKKRQIKIMHVETGVFNKDIPVDISLNTDDIQFTVYNNKKVYSLLSSVIYKKKKRDENNKSKIYNECTEY